MEKDYFLDRPDESKYFDNIHIGDFVYICEKDMQKTAQSIKDLSLIIVTQHLTSQKFHPRGQKVKGTDYQTGIEKVGRVVYLNIDGKVLTKYGLKYEFEIK